VCVCVCVCVCVSDNNSERMTKMAYYLTEL